MASSLLLLLDDISLFSKNASVAARKVFTLVPDATAAGIKSTLPVLADDLALNAEQVSGLQAKRELPVVAAIAKGSAKNKVFLWAGILGASIVQPVLIVGGLIAGGAYLAYEGVHKVMESKDAIINFFRKPFMSQEEKQELKRQEAKDALQRMHEFASLSDEELLKLEKDKIKNSIKTDLVLSAEILVISLGAMTGLGLAVQATSLAAVATIMTVGVYGLVAGIVRLDDMGLRLKNVKDDDLKNAANEMLKKPSFANSPTLKKFLGPVFDYGIKPVVALGMKALNEPANLAQKPIKTLGTGLVKGMPYLMQGLTIVGTGAMFAVGGGLLLHYIPALGFLGHGAVAGIAAAGLVGGALVGVEKVAHPVIGKMKETSWFQSISESIDNIASKFQKTLGNDIDNDKALEKQLKIKPEERKILEQYLASEKKFQASFDGLKEEKDLAASIDTSALKRMVASQNKPKNTYIRNNDIAEVIDVTPKKETIKVIEEPLKEVPINPSVTQFMAVAASRNDEVQNTQKNKPR